MSEAEALQQPDTGSASGRDSFCRAQCWHAAARGSAEPRCAAPHSPAQHGAGPDRLPRLGTVTKPLVFAGGAAALSRNALRRHCSAASELPF